MIRQCILADTGIVFDQNKLHAIGIDLSPITGLPLPRTGCESEDSEASPTITCVNTQSSIASSPRDVTPVPETHAVAEKLAQQNEANAYGVKSCSLESFVAVENGLLFNEADARRATSEDYLNAVSPMYDQLELNRYWWIVECRPMVVIDWQKNDRKAIR